MIQFSDDFKLSNGIPIPNIGFGTWQSPEGETTVRSVLAALECGYRHIDTAAAYGNEQSVGEAIRLSGLKRESLFVTSKLWNSNRGYEKTLAAFDRTMDELGLEYLDLFLIHWPAARGKPEEWQKTNAGTWRAMEKLYREGRIMAIGVSNFLRHHLEPLVSQSEIKPMVNQIELHPGQMQPEIVAYCKAGNILVEAWSPLGTGRMLSNPALLAIAAHYGKSVAQLCIRWCLQNDFLPLPKSNHPERIKENTEVFDFNISDEDMAAINSMPYFGGSGLNPDRVSF